MEQLILNIKNKNKIPFLRELLKRMEFVEVVEPKKLSAKEKKILAELDEAVDFVNKYKKGKVKAKSFNQLLDEL
ncbi:MAG: hypothetical protein P4L51_00675 [Puia sp.]|nr:hypothetical protein [Puia sp.]